jgi:S1-C subfamily serine protease
MSARDIWSRQRLVSMAAVLAFLPLGQAKAQMTEDVRAAQLDRVKVAAVRVRASRCPKNRDRLSSGFIFGDKGDDHLYVVTNVHAVAGCKEIEIQRPVSSRRAEWVSVKILQPLAVRWLRSADLALVELLPAPAGMPLPTLELPLSTASDGIPQNLLAVAAHDGADAVTSKNLRLREKGKKLRDVTDKEAVERAFSGTGLDGVLDEDVLLLDANLTPGSSGAPVVDEDGSLRGIVEGGLDIGRIGTAWAIPAARLRDAVISKDRNVSTDEAKKLGELLFSKIVLDQRYSPHWIVRAEPRFCYVLRGAAAGSFGPGGELSLGSEVFAPQVPTWSLIAVGNLGLRRLWVNGSYLSPDREKTVENLSDHEWDWYLGPSFGVRWGRIASGSILGRLEFDVEAGAHVGFWVRGQSGSGLLYGFPIQARLALPLGQAWRIGMGPMLTFEHGPPPSRLVYRSDASGADPIGSRWSLRSELGITVVGEI